MPTGRVLSAACVVLLLMACGGIDRDIDDLVTIEQGIYGQTTTYQDMAPFTGFDYLSKTVTVYSVPRDDSPPVAQATSESRGFYELSLPAGEFEICSVRPNTCHAFVVAPGARIRVDWESPLGWYEPDTE